MERINGMDVLTVEEAAEQMGITPGTLKVKMFKKEVGYIKVGKKLFLTPENVKEYLDRVTVIVKPEV